MTIIEPNKYRIRFNVALVFAVLLLVGGGVGSILMYNETVRIEHTIAATEHEIKTLQAENADYRNELYRLLDTAALEEAAPALGLFKETRPAYLEVAAQDFAVGQ